MAVANISFGEVPALPAWLQPGGSIPFVDLMGTSITAFPPFVESPPINPS